MIRPRTSARDLDNNPLKERVTENIGNFIGFHKIISTRYVFSSPKFGKMISFENYKKYFIMATGDRLF